MWCTNYHIFQFSISMTCNGVLALSYNKNTHPLPPKKTGTPLYEKFLIPSPHSHPMTGGKNHE